MRSEFSRPDKLRTGGGRDGRKGKKDGRSRDHHQSIQVGGRGAIAMAKLIQFQFIHPSETQFYKGASAAVLAIPVASSHWQHKHGEQAT